MKEASRPGALDRVAVVTGELRTIEVNTGAITIEPDDGLLETRCICGKRPEVCGHTDADRHRMQMEAELANAARTPGWQRLLTWAMRRLTGRG